VQRGRSQSVSSSDRPFITTPEGVTLPPNKDFNMVPTKPGGEWLQIHGTHIHGNLGVPHTHYPESHVSLTGIGRIIRRSRATTAEDINQADKALRLGTMRHRRDRSDRGGGP
jgi:hypothetical protein